MGFISFGELMGKVAQVQKEMEKEKAEKEALGIFEVDENTEDKKGVVVGIDRVNNRKLVIRNNTLCFDPLTPEEQENDISDAENQKNGNIRSDSSRCGVKSIQATKTAQNYGAASGGGYGQNCGNGKCYGKAYGYGMGKSNVKTDGYGSGKSNGTEALVIDSQKNENVSENSSPKRAINSSSALEKFAEFWEAYPKKYNIDQARRTFLNLNPDDELHKKILSAISNAKKTYSWRNQNGRFIPFPAKWLRNHCWEEFMYDFYG